MRLQTEGLAPSSAADRATLLRRLSLDLTGLPPSQEELRAFAQDHAADAEERLVHRLIASPHYGKRMAVPWLDHRRLSMKFQGHDVRLTNIAGRVVKVLIA